MAALVRLPSDPRSRPVLRGRSTARYLLAFLYHGRSYLRRVAYSGPILFQLEMEGIRDVPWVAFPTGVAETGPKSELDDRLTFSVETTNDKLDASCDHVASDSLRVIFFATNWSDVADNEEKRATLLQMGYEYNFW